MRLILELTPFDGELASLALTGDAFAADAEPRMFCVVAMDDHGILQVVDAGYTSLEDVLEAWPNATRTLPR